MTDDLYVVRIESHDPRLGRHITHDPASRGFAMRANIDRSTWRNKRIGVYDPKPNPNQTIGNCTGVSKCVMFNAIGNRKKGVVLKMADAVRIYSLATKIDPFPGTYAPDDTGSNGLAASKAAQQLGLGGEYRWLFGGADEVVQTIMAGQIVSVGTNWYESMFRKDSANRVAIAGSVAGGHQWTVRGYDADRDLILGRCWWGDYKDFWIKRVDLDRLLHEDGDAHVQKRVTQ